MCILVGHDDHDVRHFQEGPDLAYQAWGSGLPPDGRKRSRNKEVCHMHDVHSDTTKSCNMLVGEFKYIDIVIV